MRDVARFADLVNPHDPGAVLAARDARTALHLHGLSHDRFASLLSWAQIEQLLTAERLTTGKSRILRRGNVVPPAALVGQGIGSERVLQPVTLHDMAAQGASILIDRIDQAIPAIDLAGAIIERHFGMNVHVNAYISFGSEGALKTHWDSHHVLVMQVHGAKKWSLFGPSYPWPIDGIDAPAGETAALPGEPWAEVILQSGDLLFVPRGEIHRAAPLDGVSVHLTFGITPYRAADLLGWLVRQGEAEDAALRQDLPPADMGEADTQTDALRAALDRLGERLDLAAFNRDMARRRPLLPALNLAATGPLTAASHFRSACRRPSPPDEDGVVWAGGRRFALSCDEAAAFARIDAAGDCTLRELAGSCADPATAVRGLARHGLVIVTP